ncbi:MAG TPA: protein kinase [Chthoniobacteraceae bacterium]|jgi:hypothetical protein|nr:protein kinase [Chthoniobacteraceae bacterium]
MPEDSSSPLQTCPTCGEAVDVAEFEPLASVECPVCGSPMVVSKTLGQYELVEVMGRGGMGVVYRAIDHQLDRQVALKVLRNDFSGDAEFIKKLDEEAAITGGINHPHVVKVYTTGTAGGRFYIAMELVDQGTLDDLLSVQGRVAESQALEIASQIAQGLRAAHAVGLIHRDVKPGNILFAENHQAKIVDFGLAMLEEASKGTDEIWGTPYYVSPERLDQKPEDFRSDIYSLGATIFHAIAGRPPFEAQDASHVALKHLKNQAVSLQAFAPWVSGSTAFVINRTLNKDPAARYDSYDEFIEHLEYAKNELSAAGAQPAAKKRVVLETDEDRKLWGQITFAALGLVLLLAIGTGTYFLFFAPPDKNQGSALSNSVHATGKHATDFEAARKLLLADKPVEAAAAFHAIAVDSGAPQPLLQWSFAQEALAHLLSGSLPKAQTAMESLRKHKYTDNTPEARLLDDFFQKIATLVIDPKPVPATALGDFNRGNYGALSGLLVGMKDWELDDFDNANSALRSYQMAKPAGDFIWIGEYTPLVEDYLADLSTFRGAIGLAKAAKTQTELTQAAATLRKAKGDFRRGGAKLGPKLEEAAVAALAAVKTAPEDAASQLEKEKTMLASERMKVADSCKKWNFKEALTLLNIRPFKNSDFAREHHILQRKVEWLDQFKKQLIQDLAKGYAGPIKLADNSVLATPIVKATDAGVEIAAAAAAPEQRAWTTLSSESVCAMAESFITPDLPPAAASERRWLLGVFALLDGQRNIARKNLMDGAKGHPLYGDLLGLFMPGRRGDLARGKTITASDFIQAANNAEAPANVVDGKPETRWGANAPGEKWLRIDLGKECHILRWVVRHGHSNNEPPETNTVDFTLQKSADDAAWTDVDPVQNNVLDVTDRRLARFSTRYLRVLIKKPNRLPDDNPTAHLYGVEIYGWEGAGDIVTDFFATPPYAAPPELKGDDIGLLPADSSGSTFIDDRTGGFLIRSAGVGLGPKGDAFRFLHKAIKGDGQIMVRLDSVEPANPRAEAGVMVRDGNAPEAPFVYLGLAAGGQLTWTTRKTPGGEPAEKREIGVAFPCWVKLEGKGTAIAGSWSRDGVSWKPIGSENIEFGNTAEIGVAVMSHAPRTFTGAKLEVINFLR